MKTLWAIRVLLAEAKGLGEYSKIMDLILKKKQDLKILSYTSQPNTLAYQYLQNEIKTLDISLKKSLEENRKDYRKRLNELRGEKVLLETEIRNLPEKRQSITDSKEYMT